MQVGDKVVFIDNEGIEKNDFLKGMTIGKVYEIINVSTGMITVIADNGMEAHWFPYRFVRLGDMRGYNMIIKEDKKPCDVDICMSSDSYRIEIKEQWLCEDHVQELLDFLQMRFDELKKLK